MNPKFRIEQRSPKFELTWHRQLNASDCGPMVILNLMLADGIQGATSVGEVRGAVGNDGWFRSSEVADYLRAQGYEAELMSNEQC